jgi:hypothetical protein
MEASGSLEQQLDSIRQKAQDIRAQRQKLKKVEDLGALLEEHLILDNRYTGIYFLKIIKKKYFRAFNSWSCPSLGST